MCPRLPIYDISSRQYYNGVAAERYTRTLEQDVSHIPPAGSPFRARHCSDMFRTSERQPVAPINIYSSEAEAWPTLRRCGRLQASNELYSSPGPTPASRWYIASPGEAGFSLCRRVSVYNQILALQRQACIASDSNIVNNSSDVDRASLDRQVGDSE